jgi:hypothetical protein
MADIIPPLGVGQVDTTGVFAGDLGKVYSIGGNFYRVVKATAAIATATQGQQLATAISSNLPTWGVAINAVAANYLCCGAVPSTLTGGVAASGYFLALIRGTDVLAQTGTAASAITTGSALTAGTGGDLVRATTGALPADFDQHGVLCCGFSLALNTGTAILPYVSSYSAPFAR